MPDTPHLAIPIRLGALGTFADVEQDTPEHIAQRVQAVTLTPRGHRDDDPDFGIPDQVFETPMTDITAITAAIAACEPAATVALDRATTVEDLRVDRIQILIQEP